MATTGVINVKDLTLYRNVSDVLTAFACVQDVSISVSNNLREILCKDNGGWKQFKGGIKEWSASISGLFAFDATLGGLDLFDGLVADTEFVIRMSTEESGDIYLEGTCIVSTYDQDSSGGDSENATYSAELQGSGALAKGTVGA